MQYSKLLTVLTLTATAWSAAVPTTPTGNSACNSNSQALCCNNNSNKLQGLIGLLGNLLVLDVNEVVKITGCTVGIDTCSSNAYCCETNQAVSPMAEASIRVQALTSAGSDQCWHLRWSHLSKLHQRAGFGTGGTTHWSFD